MLPINRESDPPNAAAAGLGRATRSPTVRQRTWIWSKVRQSRSWSAGLVDLADTRMRAISAAIEVAVDCSG